MKKDKLTDLNRKIVNKSLDVITSKIMNIDLKNITDEKTMDCIKNYEKPLIVILNHHCMYDVTNAVISLDKNVAILADDTNIGALGVAIYSMLDIISVNRMDKKSREEAIPKMTAKLRSGKNVILFPEGTWCDSSYKLTEKFYSSTAKVATTENTAILMGTMFYKDNECYIKFGKPINMEKNYFNYRFEQLGLLINEKLSSLKTTNDKDKLLIENKLLENKKNIFNAEISNLTLEKIYLSANNFEEVDYENVSNELKKNIELFKNLKNKLTENKNELENLNDVNDESLFLLKEINSELMFLSKKIIASAEEILEILNTANINNSLSEVKPLLINKVKVNQKNDYIDKTNELESIMWLTLYDMMKEKGSKVSKAEAKQEFLKLITKNYNDFPIANLNVEQEATFKDNSILSDYDLYESVIKASFNNNDPILKKVANQLLREKISNNLNSEYNKSKNETAFWPIVDNNDYLNLLNSETTKKLKK